MIPRYNSPYTNNLAFKYQVYQLLDATIPAHSQQLRKSSGIRKMALWIPLRNMGDGAVQ